MIRVTIWNEYLHELEDEKVKAMHPEGMHNTLKKALACDDFDIKTAWLEKDAEHGLSQEVLDNTDVLLWWGHGAHEAVKDEVVDRVVARVQDGMGFIPLHSSHYSKPFRRLMGTKCNLHWRDIGEKAHVWTVAPSHPIAQGVPLEFELAAEEMYGEYFDIPKPDDLIFVTWYKGGNIFRGGCTFTRGNGKIFYFHPGHETYPSFYNPNVVKIISNGIRWAAPPEKRDFKGGSYELPVEPV
jgi:trehalose utilization protein